MVPQNASKSKLQEVDKNSDIETERRLQTGRILSNPLPGEEVVITGISGRFPESDDIHQLKYNLINKIDMISSDNRRWDHTHPEIPKHSGKINYIDKFDAGFFEINHRRANTMDPMLRQLLEKAFEAAVDAGVNPKDLRGTNTGVFIGVCCSETEYIYFRTKLISDAITGCSRSMFAQRLSHFMGLKGPSYVLDSACSSSMYALEHAYRAIRTGKCDSAFVGGISICLSPMLTLQFARLGVLTIDGSCKCFDEDANGYVRSEAISVVYLQKSKDAKRIYAQLLHAKGNCDGYKEQGITYPSGMMQQQLLEEVYQECGVDPTTVDFVEAHASGTTVGDPEEILAIDAVFCTNRQHPLYVGSIKSNLGHTEAASAMSSLAKVIIGMEDDCILPNLNYKRAKEGAEALENGRMIVVTEKIPWPKHGSGIVAINSFGFGGGNAHVVLKRFKKTKINEGQPIDEIPRLVCVSGRLEESVNCILNNFANSSPDAEFAALLHELFSGGITAHPYRGYIVVGKQLGELKRSINYGCDESEKSLILVLNVPHKNILSIGRQLLVIPIFMSTIQRISNILSPKGINIIEIINFENSNDLTNVIIGSIAVQIAFINILKTLDMPIDSFIAFSLGEIVAAYADNCLTLEQAVEVSYVISQGLMELINANLVSYNVELYKNKKIPVIPEEIQIVNYNSEVQYNISGPTQVVEGFITTLIKQEVLAKSERNYGFHSKLVYKIEPKLLRSLQQIISKPKKRSPKWVTTSIDKEYLASDLSKYASAEYFINNLLNPVNFQPAISIVPPNSTLIVVGETLSNFQNLPTINLSQSDNEEDYLLTFLSALGQLYILGHNFKLQELYPKIQWPVSRNTSMISPLIKWNHDNDWFIALHKGNYADKSEEHLVWFNFKDSNVEHMLEHNIDGRSLYPATGYLVLIWESFAEMTGMDQREMQVVFENVKFHRAIPISLFNVLLWLVTTIQKSTGLFEITEQDQTVVTGRIRIADDISKEIVNLPIPIQDDTEIKFSTKDIYKEFKLRGYNYTGRFRGMKECDLGATQAKIEWRDDWITFMDNMLQISLLQVDSRSLYVPTGIAHLALDAKAHMSYAKSFGENNVTLPVYNYKESGIIKSGSIEFRGLTANMIARRKPHGEPVLESYKFIPLDAELSLEKSIKVHSQIILENNYSIKIRAAELIDEYTKQDSVPVGPIVYQVLGDQPLIQPTIIVLSRVPLDLSNVTVRDEKLTSETNTCSLVIGSNMFARPETVQQAFNALKENGFILSRENLDFTPPENNELDLEILSIHQTEVEKLVLVRKCIPFILPTIMEFSQSSNQYDWLPDMQNAVKNNKNLVIYAQRDSLNGILGFVNCLRQETGRFNVKCVFINDNSASKFDVNDEFYMKQLKKGMAVNIYQDGKWGTYRHLLLEETDCVHAEHVYNNVAVRGDISSLKWFEGPLHSEIELPLEKSLIYIYKAGLNFRDIMNASGRISIDAYTRDRMQQDNVQGFEFSGRDENGKRVLGMVTSGAIASMVLADTYLLMSIPDHISMEDAVTIPVIYTTVIFALEYYGQIKNGQSILIHAGSGGIGQAAINVATYYNCEIFVTVGSPEKREFILEEFPQVKSSHIGNSRDISFEQMIMKETNGRGVDMVLNSLSEEKLQASVRCLAPGGTFLEIGKFDLVANNNLGLKNFTEGRSYFSVSLDQFFNQSPLYKQTLVQKVVKGLVLGYVKPIKKTIFKDDEVEQAYRYMAGGKHIGKIVLSIREEETEKFVMQDRRLFLGIPRFYGKINGSYIITGGLGGFGLELADWLVLRGVKNLVLVSRNGIKTGYQVSRLRIWKSYGVTTVIATDDVTTAAGCLATINKAESLGPLTGIFNLAVVLKDAIFENQNEENFATTLGPKAISTQHFDKLTREMSPELEYFVVFSSISCGRGNAGQTNYGMANSIMERICEKRKADGYPALAIQWGAIGEVGIVADMLELQTKFDIAGTVQQKVSSCLKVLDQLLRQDEPVVSSIVVAEKKYGSGDAKNIVDAVKNIIGVRDLKTISHHSTLPELGMDSMMAVEIKQTLEREYEVFLTAQDIRSMTFAKLQEISDKKAEEGIKPEENEKIPEGIYLMLRDMGSENNVGVPILRLNSLIREKSVAPKVFLLPGIEGLATNFEQLAANLASHAIALQYTYSDYSESSLEEIAVSQLKNIQDNLPKSTPFTIVAYSYGCLIGIHLVSLLEAEGRIGTLILIDGAPAMFKELLLRQIPDATSDAVLQTYSLCALMQLYIPQEIIIESKADILNCKNFEERINMVLSRSPKNSLYSENYQRQASVAAFLRFKSILTFEPPAIKLKSMVKLFKPSRPILEGYDDDYKIQQLCENEVEVLTIEGSDHSSILKNRQLGYGIITIIETSKVHFKQLILKNNADLETLKDISVKQI